MRKKGGPWPGARALSKTRPRRAPRHVKRSPHSVEMSLAVLPGELGLLVPSSGPHAPASGSPSTAPPGAARASMAIRWYERSTLCLEERLCRSGGLLLSHATSKRGDVGENLSVPRSSASRDGLHLHRPGLPPAYFMAVKVLCVVARAKPDRLVRGRAQARVCCVCVFAALAARVVVTRLGLWMVLAAVWMIVMPIEMDSDFSCVQR